MNRRVFKWISVLLCLCLLNTLAGCAGKTETDQSAYDSEEIHAVWFSYLDYEERCSGMNKQEFSDEVGLMLNQMQDVGINTVYVHASAFTDALYDSKIYPKSASIAGMDYDPLKIFCEQAKGKNMRIEAWINPLRSVTSAEAESLDSNFIISKWIQENNERIRLVSDRYYLNPAYQDVRDLAVSVVREILDNYDVDGIHMDDYFYPDDTAKSFDAYIYSQSETGETLEDFRRSATSTLVKEIHDAVKEKDSSLVFGISPAGNTDLNLNVYYADPSAWVKDGTVDYLAPQIYWGLEHPTKPYAEILAQWQSITAGTDTDLIIGLAAYKCGIEDVYAKDASQEWVENSDILSREILISQNAGCKGTALFRYSSLFAPSAETAENVDKEIINIKSAYGVN